MLTLTAVELLTTDSITSSRPVPTIPWFRLHRYSTLPLHKPGQKGEVLKVSLQSPNETNRISVGNGTVDQTA